MADPIQDLHEHVDRRFGEIHESLEGIRADVSAIRTGQLEHVEAHAASATKGQATGISAVVAAVITVLSQVFTHRISG